MIVVVILLIIVVIVLGVWGALEAAASATTSATALTLATTNAVSQTTILVLACALLASVPLLIYGAFRLGAFTKVTSVIGDRKRGYIGEHAAPIRLMERGRFTLTQGKPVAALPGERIAILPLPEPQSEPTAIVPRLRVKRASRHTRQAARVAQRWFR